MVELNINRNNSKTLALVIIGTLRALRLKVLSINEAQQIIFSPAILGVLRSKGYDQRIIDMIHLGTELENIESIIPNQLEKSIGDIERMAVQYLESEPRYDYNEEKTLVSFISAL
jgi:hypothetical protein